ncbi:hypothetical protein JCM33374_g2471 [Metschnikowia sp. JCM 33374]|nr:hypothetical protein JCM33374_g2471 [Metschnikowia sp. JCM 33374]
MDTSENNLQVQNTPDDESVMSLPLSKIKKIFKMDPEYAGSSASAVYATGAATELFVQYLVEQASMNAKADKRKKIQYRDLSAAVSSQESLYFLSDTIPRTQPVEKALREKQINVSEEDRIKHRELLGEDAQTDQPAKEPTPSAQDVAETEKKPVLSKGQSTLPFASVPNPKTKKAGLSDLIAAEEETRKDEDAMVIDG